jgi:hypothetical protein
MYVGENKETPTEWEKRQVVTYYLAVFRIWSRKFLGLPDPDSDPSTSSKNKKNNLDFYCFVFISLMNDVNAPSKNKQKYVKEKYFLSAS